MNKKKENNTTNNNLLSTILTSSRTVGQWVYMLHNLHNDHENEAHTLLTENKFYI